MIDHKKTHKKPCFSELAKVIPLLKIGFMIAGVKDRFYKFFMRVQAYIFGVHDHFCIINLIRSLTSYLSPFSPSGRWRKQFAIWRNFTFLFCRTFGVWTFGVWTFGVRGLGRSGFNPERPEMDIRGFWTFGDGPRMSKKRPLNVKKPRTSKRGPQRPNPERPKNETPNPERPKTPNVQKWAPNVRTPNVRK